MAANGISQGGSGLPSRVIFHGTEGIGKTSLLAHSTKPVVSMTRGETGLLTLIDNHIIEPTAHFDEVHDWDSLLGNISYLIKNDTPYKTYGIDTMNGAERLCFEHVCTTRFDGEWKKFLAYGRGPDESLAEWLHFLALLDQLRATRRMAILCLCHTRVKTFKNPEGDDYDRYSPDMNDKVWGLSHKWADAVLFGNYFTIAKKEPNTLGKAKGRGQDERFLYTTRTAAYDAKNRLALPSQIPMGRDGKEAWANLKAAMIAARQRLMPATNESVGSVAIAEPVSSTGAQ